MNSTELIVPGKVFIAGEYLAVHQGKSLVMATEPFFKFYRTSDVLENFKPHPGSPAGKFIRDFKIEDYYKFVDGYQGRGGFGASTAQFILSYFSRNNVDRIDLKDVFSCYQKYAYSGKGIRPSGADLVAQIAGGFCVFDPKDISFKKLKWPFENLELVLFFTKNKLATHEHLLKLENFNSSGLQDIFLNLMESWSLKSEQKFINGIQSYREELKDLGFECMETSTLLESVLKLDGVCSAKGCGAMGSDVILLVVEKNRNAQIKKHLIEMGYDFILTQENVAQGYLK